MDKSLAIQGKFLAIVSGNVCFSETSKTQRLKAHCSPLVNPLTLQAQDKKAYFILHLLAIQLVTKKQSFFKALNLRYILVF